jgi:hypothetical protein
MRRVLGSKPRPIRITHDQSGSVYRKVRKAFGRDWRSLPFERRGSLLQTDGFSCGLFERPASLRATAAACYLTFNSPAEELEAGTIP